MNEQEFYTALGERFKALREKSGLTPAQVSRRISFNRSLLMKFEEQGKKISAFRINQLLNIFGLQTIEEIFSDEEDKKKIQITLSGDGLGDLALIGETETLWRIAWHYVMLFNLVGAGVAAYAPASPYLHAALSGTVVTLLQLAPPYASALEFGFGLLFAALIQGGLASGAWASPRYHRDVVKFRAWWAGRRG